MARNEKDRVFARTTNQDVLNAIKDLHDQIAKQQLLHNELMAQNALQHEQLIAKINNHDEFLGNIKTGAKLLLGGVITTIGGLMVWVFKEKL